MSTEETLTGKHLIAGEWVSSTGAEFTAKTAGTGEALQPGFHEATEAEVNAAVAAAVAAYNATRDLPGARWADLLEAIADSIQSREAPLVARANLETGLPEARLKGEIGRTTGQLRLFGKLVREGSWVDAVIDTADPDRKPLPKPDVRRMRRALGPVAVFDASNFPFAFGPCGGDTASALAAGNPVIVKSHPGHPGNNELFGAAVLEALRATGLPVGTFGLLQGAGVDLSGLLVRHPDVEAVGFTGSQRAGRALYDIAAARPRPIPVYAEMGSINPLIVLPGALAERSAAIAEGLAGSITQGVGQFCTKPGLIFILEDDNADSFAAQLTEKLSAVSAGTMLYSGLQQRFAQSVHELQAATGVTTLLKGACFGNANSSPSLLQVDAATWRVTPALQEEMFGPAALLVRCADADELLQSLQRLTGNLTGTIHTGGDESPELMKQVAGVLETKVGRLIFNGYPTGVEVCHAMVHGGPYPATTAPATTSVGTAAIRRFVRPVAYQNIPDALLPPALQTANPLGIWRTVNGEFRQ
jgi:alpha-ketoglutaric semialdehyde dehydrogenase